MSPTGETVALNRPKASPSQRARGQAPAKRAERTVAEPKDMAVEDWENEGGQLRKLRSAAISPSDALQRARERPTPSAELAAMRTKFLADFAGGFVGQHHHTFQHRSRVLRQLTAYPESRGVAAQAATTRPRRGVPDPVVRAFD